MKKFEELDSAFKGKRLVFITTKNLDYIRNSQEIKLLAKKAERLEIIGSKESSYPKRLTQVFKQLRKLNMSETDLVFVGFAPQLILPFFYGKLKKKPIVIDFFISVYDTMVLDRKKFKDGSLMAKLCHRLDEKTLKKADYIICDTMAHGQFFVDELRADAEKMHVLYLEADTSIYSKKTQLKSRAAHSICSNPEPPKANGTLPHRVLYFGSILPLQGVEVILEALKEFVDDSDYYFEIIGPIPENYEKPVANNISYPGWLSQEELAEHIAQADLCLAGHFSKDIDKAKRTIPGKAYIYEAMGRPMILGDGPANHELFSPDENHIFVPMGDSAALAKEIREFFNK